MRKTIRGALPLGFLGLVFVILTMPIAPGFLGGGEFEIADSTIDTFRDAVYNHAFDEDGIRQLYIDTLTNIRTGTGSESVRKHREALIHYYLGRYYQALKTRELMADYAGDLRNGRYLALRRYYIQAEQAIQAYENARKAAEECLELDSGAESHRLYGEILGQMLFLGTAGQALAIGPRARREVKLALELDPANTKARIQEASRLAYSPAVYGGNPEKAREMYQEILRNGQPDREDLFNIYGGFAMAAFMEGNDAEAAVWFDEASGVYPGNIFSLGMNDYIRGALR